MVEVESPTIQTEEQPDTRTDLEKIKARNDEFEKELIRGRELREEKQKLEAEAQLGGTNGGHVEAKPAPEVSPEDYAKAAMAGELPDVKE